MAVLEPEKETENVTAVDAQLMMAETIILADTNRKESLQTAQPSVIERAAVY